MGCFYFDESIHERGGFIVGAFVYSLHDLSPAVREALMGVGLQPGINEFKSSSKMSQDPVQSRLRSRLKHLLRSTKLGLVVLPFTERAVLGNASLMGLKKILVANGLETIRHQAFFDEGVTFLSRDNLIAELELTTNCDLYFDQDSRDVAGIQLADLSAHTFAIIWRNSA